MVISPLHADHPIDRAFCLTLRGYKATLGRGLEGSRPCGLHFLPLALSLFAFAELLQPQERPWPKAHCVMQDTL